jgi:predicted nuclease of predicted toxin-antitoxin system
LIETAEIRLVLDQGLPRDAAGLLRELGHECAHVGEVGMARAPDREILAWAVEQNATVVTLDADFHAILAVSGASAPSVIRIRMQGLDATAVVDIIRKVFAAFRADLTRGSLVTVKAHKITCHKLPIGGGAD